MTLREIDGERGALGGRRGLVVRGLHIPVFGLADAAVVHGAAGDGGDVYVFDARRRPESLGWAVPADDGALLGGVGARGDARRKGDDTFEMLLLMGLPSDE